MASFTESNVVMRSQLDSVERLRVQIFDRVLAEIAVIWNVLRLTVLLRDEETFWQSLVLLSLVRQRNIKSKPNRPEHNLIKRTT